MVEVSAAMRLDRPSPLGARILLHVDRPAPAASTFSSASVFSTVCFRGRVDAQEADRPTVDRPGRAGGVSGKTGVKK